MLEKIKKNKILVITVGLAIILLGGNFALDKMYSSAIVSASVGEYDEAISKLKIVTLFNKGGAKAKKTLKIAEYEQGVVPVVEQFISDLEDVYPKIKLASSVKEVQILCDSLEGSFDEFEKLELEKDSEISEYINRVRNNRLYELIKDDYVFGNYLESINITFLISNTVKEMAVYTATEIPSRSIKDVLDIERPKILEASK